MSYNLDETDTTGSFYMGELDKKVAEICWKKHDGYIEVDETRVDDSLKGHGIGIKLFELVVEHARKNSLKVEPVCPFVVAMFEKRPKCQDLLVK